MRLSFLFVRVIGSVSLLGLLGACGPTRPEPDVLQVAVAPNRNMIPPFVAIDQQNEDLRIEVLPDLRLWNLSVWRALYLVARPQVGGLDDLVGKKILASFPGGAPDLQAGFEADVWQAGLLPLGATFTTQALLRAALERFDEAYAQACAYAMAHPNETGEIVERAFAAHFDGQMPAQAVADAIEQEV